MGLSNYQLVLLDNLIYLDEVTRGYAKDNTIGDIVRNLLYKDGNEANGIGTGTITTDCHGCYQPDNPEAQNCMMTEEEWIEVLKAIKADKTLCSLTIHKVEDHREGELDGFRAMALTGDSVDENIIIFKGTSSAEEWIEDGQGGYSISTAGQQQAVDFVNGIDIVNDKSFVVSGHSKGGNMAQYVALFATNPPIDRCLNFDGQGFSEELCNTPEYQEAIARKGQNLYLIASSGDFVNVLFNSPVPENHKMYLTANGVGLAVQKYHCPNNVFEMENGKITGLKEPKAISLGSYFIQELIEYIIKTETDEEKKKILCDGLMGIMAATAESNDDMELLPQLDIKTVVNLGIDALINTMIKYIAAGGQMFEKTADDICKVFDSLFGDKDRGELLNAYESGTFDLLGEYLKEFISASPHNCYLFLALTNDTIEGVVFPYAEDSAKTMFREVWGKLSNALDITTDYNIGKIWSEIAATKAQSSTLGEGTKGNIYINRYNDGGILYLGNGENESGINGTIGNDILYGGNGADDINGGAGNDVLWGGRGNDLLIGGYGSDRYVFGLYDGHDTIINDKSDNYKDYIIFDDDVKLSDLAFQTVGLDLLISVGESSQITVKDFFVMNDDGTFPNAIESIQSITAGRFKIDFNTICKLAGYKEINSISNEKGGNSLTEEEKKALEEERRQLKEWYEEYYDERSEQDSMISDAEGGKENSNDSETLGGNSSSSSLGSSGSNGGVSGGSGNSGSSGTSSGNSSSGSSSGTSGGFGNSGGSGGKANEDDNASNSANRAKDEIFGDGGAYQDSMTVKPVDPIIVDLNGDGVFTTSLTDGTYFDLNKDGFAEKTAWVTPEDALLVRDVNGNGKIDDGGELFGDRTILSDGSIAKTGFQALADLDDNNDNLLDAHDNKYDELKIWIDRNHNGTSETEELYSLEDFDITSIDLKYRQVNRVDENGNLIKADSNIYGQGVEYNIGEYGFHVDFSDTEYRGEEIDTSALEEYLPEIKGCGTLLDLSKAMSLNEDLKVLVSLYIEEKDFFVQKNLLQNIVYLWADVSEVEADSRGGLIDARKLGVLEKAYGQPFNGVSGCNPNNAAAAILNKLYVEFEKEVETCILSQSVYQNALAKIKVYRNADTGIRYCNFVSVIKTLVEERSLYYIPIFVDYILTNTDLGGLFDKQYIYKQIKSENIIWAEILNAKNIVYRTSGVDIKGSEQDDTLLSSTENDILSGGKGADTYIFNLGDGEDVINNCDSETWKNDRIIFGEGIKEEDIELYRSGSDLVFRNKTSGDKVTLKSAFDSSYRYIGSVEFADGTKWDEEYLQENTRHYAGTEGDDVLNGQNRGYNYNQNETFRGGAGNDTINGNDGNDIMDGGSGNDTLNGGNGDDILKGETGNDILYGGKGADTYIFNLGDGEDVINNCDSETWKNDRIVFGEGIKEEDIKLYRSGSDLVFRNKTSGDKVTLKNAFDSSYRYIGSVEFADGTKWDEEYLQENTRHYAGTEGDDVLNGQGRGYNYNQNETFRGGAGNDTINGNDGNDIMNGGSGNDTLNGGNGDDILTGETGNDILYGGNGADTYIFNLGDGEDVINNCDSETWKNDRIVFGEGIKEEDIKLYRSGSDLVFRNKTSGDKVTLKSAFDSSYRYIGSVEFADGTKWDEEYLQENTRHYVGTEGDDVLNGQNRGYNYNQNETFRGGAGNDTINGNDGNDIMDGGSGNDTLNGGNGDDILTGETGNDILYGGKGADTYIFNLGDGEDVINNCDSETWKNDRIVFGEGIKEEDIKLYRSGSDLVFRNKTSGDKVTLKNAFDSSYRYIGSVEFADGTKWDEEYLQENTRHYAGTEGDDVLNGQGRGYNYNQNETFRGGAGNDTINGNDGNDIMDGGSGNDTLNGGNGDDILTGETGNDILYGGNGADTYIFNLGDGEDVINNCDSETWKNDRIVFGEGIKEEDIKLYRSGSDLVFRNKTSGDKVTLKSAFDSSYRYIGSVEFADGTKWDEEYLQENTRHYIGTEGDDVLNGQNRGYNYNQNETFRGGAGNDTINGNDGNDIMDGGSGNDTLNGGNGDDTYLFSLGDGDDTIMEGGGTDKIVFGKEIECSNVMFAQEGNNLRISFVGQDDNIKISNYFCNDRYKVESFQTSDGYTLDYTKLNVIIQAMASFEDTTGMMWEDAIEQKNEQANDLVNQWWTREVI